jgi:hypothetical protein
MSEKNGSPEHWRSRAAEVRARAAKTSDPNFKSILLDIAKDYDKLAELAELK